MKVGDVFWKVSWSEDGHEMEEWLVSTIRRAPRKRYLFYPLDEPLNPITVYFIQKINGITWGKRSRTTGDYGWEETIEPMFRASRTLDECKENGPPKGLKTTKLQAYNHAIRSCEKEIKQYERDEPEDVEYLGQLKRTLTSMKSRRSRIRTR